MRKHAAWIKKVVGTVGDIALARIEMPEKGREVKAGQLHFASNPPCCKLAE